MHVVFHVLADSFPPLAADSSPQLPPRSLSVHRPPDSAPDFAVIIRNSDALLRELPPLPDRAFPSRVTFPDLFSFLFPPPHAPTHQNSLYEYF